MCLRFQMASCVLNLDGSVGGYGCVFRRVESSTTTQRYKYCDYYDAMKMINFYINNQNLMEQFH